MIATNYLNNGFLIDLVCILPFQFITLQRNRQYLFYIIKLVRLTRTEHIIDVSRIMAAIKTYYME